MPNFDLHEANLMDVAVRAERAVDRLAKAITANVLEGFVGAALVDGELVLLGSLPDILSDHERTLLLGALARQSHALLNHPDAIITALSVPLHHRLN